MRFSIITAITLPLLHMVSGQQGACQQITVRKEVRDLSDQERNAWINAIKSLYTNKRDGGDDSIIDWFADIHIKEYNGVHSDPKFLPWHRYFLHMLQEKVRQVDGSVTLPYWDWARDSQAVHDSPVLSDSFIGGNGDEGRGWDLTSGPFGNTKVKYPNPHTIKRCYHKTDGGRRFTSPALDPFPDTTIMNAVVNQYTDYSDFAWNLELYHGFLHVLMGDNEGDLGPPQSPNDPAFFLHHANIDRYWWQWQRRHPDSAHSYNGQNYNPSKNADANDNMSFAGNTGEVRVNTMFNTEDYPLCYTYADNTRQMLDADGQPKPLVNGTKLMEKTITFDKMKELTDKINNNTQNSSNSTNNNEPIKKSNNPQIKEINPLVILGMAENMNMKMDTKQDIEMISRHTKQLKLISSLDGFNNPNKN